MFSKVQRVHWIRARAQRNRWEEELILIRYEMQWTTKSFLHWAQIWEERFQEGNSNPGPKAYAARQCGQWRSLATDADQVFRSINSDYTSLVAQ